MDDYKIWEKYNMEIFDYQILYEFCMYYKCLDTEKQLKKIVL